MSHLSCSEAFLDIGWQMWGSQQDKKQNYARVRACHERAFETAMALRSMQM